MSKKNLLDIGYCDSLSQCCGVNVVGSFETYDEGETNNNWNPPDVKFDASGTGFFVSTFINNEECKAAYEHLTKEHVLLYQSPKRKNGVHGNEIFLCVFMHRSKAGSIKKVDRVVTVREAAITPTFPFPQRKGEKLPTI